jgi:hypothetical protein
MFGKTDINRESKDLNARIAVAFLESFMNSEAIILKSKRYA